MNRINYAMPGLYSYGSVDSGNDNRSDDEIDGFSNTMDQLNGEYLQQAIQYRKDTLAASKESNKSNIASTKESIAIKRGMDVRNEINTVSQSS